jgi:hypothetical protein
VSERSADRVNDSSENYCAGLMQDCDAGLLRDEKMFSK